MSNWKNLERLVARTLSGVRVYRHDFKLVWPDVVTILRVENSLGLPLEHVAFVECKYRTRLPGFRYLSILPYGSFGRGAPPKTAGFPESTRSGLVWWDLEFTRIMLAKGLPRWKSAVLPESALLRDSIKQLRSYLPSPLSTLGPASGPIPGNDDMPRIGLVCVAQKGSRRRFIVTKADLLEDVYHIKSRPVYSSVSGEAPRTRSKRVPETKEEGRL